MRENRLDTFGRSFGKPCAHKGHFGHFMPKVVQLVRYRV